MNPGPAPALVERLRNRVLTALHTGRLEPGDRLPSVRSAAEEMEVDPRTIMEVYHRLESEGLVEVRPRSGVYLADDDSPSPSVSGEASQWVATEVAVGAWQRRISLPDLPDFIRSCFHARELTCVCVDEIEDDRIAICSEIQEDFGMDVRVVEPLDGGGCRVGDTEMELRAALSGGDLIVVTAYHERTVRPLAETLDIPVVVSTLNPAGVEEIRDLTAESTETVFVILDRRAERRLQEGYGDTHTAVTVAELDDGAEPPGEGPLIFTPAAADAVGELPDRAVVPLAPIISPDTAEQLAAWMVRLNLRHAENDGA